MSRRIAIISEHASPLGVLGGDDAGGQNVYVAQVAKGLSKFGYEVDIFTRRDNKDCSEKISLENGINLFHVTAGPPSYIAKEKILGYMPEFTRETIRIFNNNLKIQKKYDLIHANFFMSGLVACQLKAIFKIPFIITFHALGRIRRFYQGSDDHFSDERFAIEDQIVQEADRIIAECPQDKEDLIRLYNANPEKITLIPCGFDTAEFWPISKSSARSALGLDPDVSLVLQLGRMVPRKGVDNAIRGFANFLKRKKQKSKMIIVGGNSSIPDSKLTPEIGRLQKIVCELEIDKFVKFAGSKPRHLLRNYYSAADVFITTPWYEPFGITCVESMACGTPVIGSNVGGIKFSVRDGETGYLVPPNDPDALGERLEFIYNNPKLLEVLGRQSIQRACDLFTWDKVANAFAILIEDVLEVDGKSQSLELLSLIDISFNVAIDLLGQVRQRIRKQVKNVLNLLLEIVEKDEIVFVYSFDSFEADSICSAISKAFNRNIRGITKKRKYIADSQLYFFNDPFGYSSNRVALPKGVLIIIDLDLRDECQKDIRFSLLKKACEHGMKTIVITSQSIENEMSLADVYLAIPEVVNPRFNCIKRFTLDLIITLLESQISIVRQTKRFVGEKSQVRVCRVDLGSSVDFVSEMNF